MYLPILQSAMVAGFAGRVSKVWLKNKVSSKHVLRTVKNNDVHRNLKKSFKLIYNKRSELVL